MRLLGGPVPAVMLEGEAGIGKTTVWNAALDAARSHGTHVLTSAPTEVEARLSYAGLADLLGADFEAVAKVLPAPQARALAVALRLEEPGPRRFVGRLDKGSDAAEIDSFTDDEREKILGWFREHQPGYHAFVYCRFWTGTRPSEAIALRWGDIDLPGRRVRIRRSRVLGKATSSSTRGSTRCSEATLRSDPTR